MALSGRNREFTLEVFMQSKRSQRTQFRRNGAQPGAISIFNFMPAIRFAATPDKKPGMTTASPQCPTSVTRQNKASFQAYFEKHAYTLTQTDMTRLERKVKPGRLSLRDGDCRGQGQFFLPAERP